MRASRPLLREYLSPIIAGLVHAGLMACAFPPVRLWPLAFLALLPLIWMGLRERDRILAVSAAGPGPRTRRRVWRALRTPLLVSVGTLPLWAYEQVWVIEVSALGYYPFAGLPSLFSGIFVGLLGMVGARWPRAPMAIIVPILWIGLEVFRGEVAFTGYSWLLLAHPLAEWPVMAQPASLLGTYFVGFMVAAVSGAVADIAMVRPARRIAASAAVGAAIAIWVLTPLLAPRGPGGPGGFRVAVVQTNIPQSNKNDWPAAERLAAFDRFMELTREAAGATPRPDLIVWPETMFPGMTLDTWFAEHLEARAARGDLSGEYASLLPILPELLDLQARVGIPFLIGAPGFDLETGRGGDARVVLFNSAFLIEGGRVSPTRYDKLLLTPFGEIMPYISSWPWLEQKLLDLGAHGMTFDLTPGAAPRAFEVPTPGGPVVVTAPICFEATKAGVNRRLVLQHPSRPQVIVNLTNDGWFGGFDPGRWQHLQIAQWRAVELGVPVVRAANTGVSTSIDGRGRILKAGVEGSDRTTRVDGVLLADVAPARPRTLFALIGGGFSWLVLAAAALVIAAGVRRRSTPASRASPG